MGELGRYMGKLELGCEETDLGKVRERRREKPSSPRTTMGSQEMEDTASTKTPRGLEGHPTRGASGLARTQRKAAGGHLQSRILKSLYT